MTQHSIEFQFQGEDRDLLAKELSELLADTFADWPQHTADKIATPTDIQKSDPVAIATLVLAVPSTVLATWDPAKRMQLTAKVNRLINWAKQKVSAGTRGDVTIRLPNGVVVQLDKVKPEEILDMLAELAKM